MLEVRAASGPSCLKRHQLSESSMYKTLSIERQGRVATLWMDRPEVFNAFDEQLIDDLQSACAELDADALGARRRAGQQGRHFSAGADLNWMRARRATPRREPRRCAPSPPCCAAWPACPATIARPGRGARRRHRLAAACDMAVASRATLRDLRGQVRHHPGGHPALCAACHPVRQALRYFRAPSASAPSVPYEIGLVSEVCELEDLDATVARIVEPLIAGARWLKGRQRT